jgi:uncharacterized protein (DUF2141 family)
VRRLVIAALLLASSASAQEDASVEDDTSDDATVEEEAPPTRRIVVTVITRNNEGKIYCGMWRGREGYPTQRQHAVGQTRDRTIVNNRGVCIFEDIPPGEYAIAAFHDENGNNDLDRNFVGIPSEGTGASNDARGFMGPPSYDDARFQFPETVNEARLIIRIGY